MAQIFSPNSNVLVKVGLLGTVLAVPALGAGMYAVNMVYGYKYYIPVEQPVQFSHRHHVGDDGIDCRYCHTSVEKSFSAGMPPTHTCMSCHSQIWSDSPELQAVRASYLSGQPIRWNRVHDMPDFVYFNHSIHIKKGVGCETCHGRADEKQLMFKSHTMTMSWCLECHRQPEKFLRPRDAVYTMGWRPGMKGSPGGGAITGVQASKLSETASGRAALMAGQKPGAEHAGSAGAGGEHAGEEHGEETAVQAVSLQQANVMADGGDYSGFTNQLELGRRLKADYRVRSARELTDCGACHR